MIRQARVRAFAKINLDLRVLYKHPDQYHELRTIFQTISLSDRLNISYTRGRTTSYALTGNLDIPNNLVLRAAAACMEEMRVTGHVAMELEKSIPMGAGLGGGSSDAAAVLLALPPLAGRVIPIARLIAIGRELGSDVPFFLLGGRAVGIGRGTELYPLRDLPSLHGIVVAPGIHVSTAEAYRALGRGALTTERLQNNIDSFIGRWWDECGVAGQNDFEEAIFSANPLLARLKRLLVKLGAEPAMMSGSGSSIFGFFRTLPDVSRALKSFQKERVFRISLMSRARYQSFWRRSLRVHTADTVWPPQSRYSQ
ncbi:MAG: 4-(cytidine 5'-diphospho)-2-C-methyl-D-erythritol kinase [Bryobacteraceae bacterium]